MDEQVSRLDRDIATRPYPGTRRIGRRAVWLLLFLAAAAALLMWWRPWGGTPAPAPAAHGRGDYPQSVRVATAALGDIPVRLNGLGTVTPLANVVVKTQISGQLLEIGFKEGQLVQKGDFLAQVDPRPYQVALEQAQGQMARDQALLKQAETNFNRYQQLMKQDSIARQQVEDQRFLVQQYQGALIADQAQIDSAKLNIAYCRILAPVAGRVGLRQVDAGNYVQNSDGGGIVVITQLQPISVLFPLPQSQVATVMAALAADPALPVEAWDSGNTRSIASGHLATIDNQIDPTTGTVKLRAVFDNADGALFPNLFVNAHLLVETVHGAVTLPVPAVLTGAPGTYVWLVKPDNTVTVRPVKAGPSDGEHVAILSGLQAGDPVVLDGVDRLREGAKVTIPGAAADTPAGKEAPPAPGTHPSGGRRHQPAG